MSFWKKEQLTQFDLQLPGEYELFSSTSDSLWRLGATSLYVSGNKPTRTEAFGIHAKEFFRTWLNVNLYEECETLSKQRDLFQTQTSQIKLPNQEIVLATEILWFA